MKYKMTYHHWKHTFDHKWTNPLSVYWRLRQGKTEIQTTFIYACGFDQPYDDDEHLNMLDHPSNFTDHVLHAREGE